MPLMKPIHCRMARAALGWSTQDLAREAAVGINTVNRFEAGQDARMSSVSKIQAAIEAAGVMLIEENGEGPGVRLRKSHDTSV
jgi:transcriptional regulator with XRE-family HTH domain